MWSSACVTLNEEKIRKCNKIKKIGEQNIITSVFYVFSFRINETNKQFYSINKSKAHIKGLTREVENLKKRCE